jgi:hypothetical protein
MLPFRLEAFRKIELAMRNADKIPDDQLTKGLYWHQDTPGLRRVKKDKLNIFHGE